MAHIVSPFFPEPITVPDNVAEKSYRSVVRFVRIVGLANLATILLVCALIAFWLRPDALIWLSAIETASPYLLAAGSLFLLAALRAAPVALQLAVFTVFALSFSASVALWGAFMHDAFPLFVEGAIWAFLATAFGMVVYCLAAARDFSFVGAFALVWVFAMAVIVGYTFLTDMIFSEGMTIAVAITLMLFYWLYDLAMILRRRTERERVSAVLDLYRDVLNFVGFPIRMMRMPRGRRRLRQQW